MSSVNYRLKIVLVPPRSVCLSTLKNNHVVYTHCIERIQFPAPALKVGVVFKMADFE